MTIRRTLQGWFTYLRITTLLVGILAYSWHDNGYNHGFRAVVLSSLLFCVVGLFAYAFRCPRCGKSLLLGASNILMTSAQCVCPKCGVNLDEAAPK
jgi:predicted RNA-binding Zn-ribbon protein involved in translation (DUF1610 family)